MTAGTWTATIGGSAVTITAGSLSVTNEVGQRSQGSLQVKTALGVLYQYGTRVLIYDDTGALAYSGYTTHDKATKPTGSRQGQGWLEHDIQLMDNCYRADKRRVFKSYLNVSAGYIVNDLLGAYLAPEGVTATATSIAAGGTITEVIWAGSKSVSEALTWLAQQSGYWWQIDKNGVLWFQPYSGVPAPWALDGTQADSLQELSVISGNDMYVNKQYVKGSYSEKGPLTETFHGNSLTRSFTLAYPVATISSVTLNGADVTAQSLTKGSSGGQFYYAKNDAVVAQDTGQPLLTSSDTLVVTYKGRIPVLASAQNSALITAQQTREGGGTGLVESVYTNTKVRTLPAAFQISSALLAHYGEDATLLSFTTRQSGLAPGQLLSVTLPDFNLSAMGMLIASVTITDAPDNLNIWYQVSAIGSPLEVAQWQTYWANLMAQSSDPSDYVDTVDTSLALLTTSSFTRTPSVTITQTKVMGPICNVSMMCGQWTVA